MKCPICHIEFDTPYIREAWRTAAPVWCPKGHKLEFVPPVVNRSVQEQVETLERMFASEDHRPATMALGDAPEDEV